MLIRTSSHKWGRWYLPMFLFRDGLLTLMNIDSLINLESFCSSLPTMLKFSSEVVWPVVLLWSCMGGLQMFFVPLSKCSWCFSNILLITFQPITFEPINYTTRGCLAKENIFPYARWSQISWICESLCSSKKLFCYREIRFKNFNHIL